MSEGFRFAAFLLFFYIFSRGHARRVSICVFPVLFPFVNFVVSFRVCLSACSFFVAENSTANENVQSVTT
jgi:hypothetical protein